jgi:folate-binding protein YgfZ
LRLTGRDRVRLLNSLTTNDVAGLEAGGACRSALTTVKGKLLAELFVLRREHELLVVVAQGATEHVAATIDKHIIADDVTVTDLSRDTAVLAVEGPKARGVVWRLFPTTALPARTQEFVDADYLGTPVCVLRASASGEDGYHLLVPAGDGERIREYVIQSGYADDMALVGRVAWNRRRVEAGLPWWGADVNPGDNFPLESRLEDIVSYTKGCFLGQETLARMYHRGHPNRKLVGLAPKWGFSPPGAADADGLFFSLRDAPLYRGDDADKQAGRITSAAYSPVLDGPLLLGYVRADLSEPGSVVALRSDGADTALEVIALPVSR